MQAIVLKFDALHIPNIYIYSGERKKCRIENSLFSPNQKQTKNRFFNGATERYIVSRFALD